MTRKPTKTPAEPVAEIEITPEMIWAVHEVLGSWHPFSEISPEALADAYRAMACARR